MKAIINRSINKIKPNLIKNQIKFFSTQNSETFYAKDLIIEERKNKLSKPDYDKPLLFGTYHTDHILEIDYDENGWNAPKISGYHNFEIDPRNSTLHYAIELFEGMKAYKSVHDENKVILFRPEMNMRRMINSAERIGLPSFNGNELINCIERFVHLDRDWIPKKRGYSMYIRPTYISMTNQLGVLPPREAKLFVILSPVGPYFPSGFDAIKIVCSEQNHRSWPGGFGYAKLGANYGPTLQYYKKIKEQGYTQILWLINDIVTEVGVMNFFIYWINKSGEKELITCPLDGTVLPGVVRDSILHLVSKWGIKTTERHFKIQEVIEALEEGRLLEAFGSGTAAIVCPIREIAYKDRNLVLIKEKEKTIGDLGKRIYDHLLDIQTGVIQHEWARVIGI